MKNSLTIKGVIKITGLFQNTIYRYIRQGKIKTKGTGTKGKRRSTSSHEPGGREGENRINPVVAEESR